MQKYIYSFNPTNKFRIYSEWKASGQLYFCIMNENDQILLHAIGKKIAKRRKELGLTQEDLAFSANIDRTYIGYIENGKNNVTVIMLCKIAKALKMDIKDLL